MKNPYNKLSAIQHVGPATGLRTKEGIAVSMSVTTETKSKDVYFFMDEDYNHRLWTLTIKKGLVFNHIEYNRLKNVVGLEEFHISENKHRILFILAKAIAKKVFVDPYYGLTKQQCIEAKEKARETAKSRLEKQEAVKKDNMVNMRGIENLLNKPIGKVA